MQEVSQGSILGPILFTMYVDDLINEISNSQVKLYVDNLRSGSIFVSLWELHSGGQDETKREPDTNL